MVKILKHDLEALESVGKGVKKLARAVKATLGPKGRHVVLKKEFGPPVSTKDGVSVAKEVVLQDPFENIGAQLIKEASTKTALVAGDGTTTAIVLADAIFSEGIKGVTAGLDPMRVKKGIDLAVSKIEEALDKQSEPVSSQEEVENIATISANNDRAIGSIVAEAMSKVGRDGIISVGEAQGLATELEVVEGVEFKQGFVSPYFVTNAEQMSVIMDNASILILEKKLSSAGKDFIFFLEEIVKGSKLPLLIIAEDIDGEALTTLVFNKIKGGLNICAVKAPEFGDRRKALLEDIACITGATVISEDVGLSLENFQLSWLGKAKQVKVFKDKTTIVDGYSDKKRLKEREEGLRYEISKATSDFEKEKLEERLAKLIGGVAVIKIGAFTESELKEKKDRVEDALHATRAAVVEGIVPGGGVALMRASESLKDFSENLSEEELFGIDIVKKACKAPLISIADNCGQDGCVVIEEIAKNTDLAWGYNGLTDSFTNLVKAGVLDPVLVTKSALRNAASVAGLLLTSNVVIAKKPEEKSKVSTSTRQMPGMMPPGMMGM